MLALFSRRLYLRIWLAVVGGVAVLTLAVGWAWRVAAEQNEVQRVQAPREVVLRNAQGDVVGNGVAQRVRGEGIEFKVDLDSGDAFVLQVAPREPGPRGERGPRGPRERDTAFWTRPPFGFLWMLGLVGIAVALGVFPIIRRLLLRLEVVAQIAAGQCLARAAFTADPHPYGPGADGRRPSFAPVSPRN